MGARVLYICYHGVLEPLGQSQVLAYMKKLAKEHEMILVSYEKPHDWADRPLRETILADVGKAAIRWVPLTYHKRPTLLAKSYDLLLGFLVSVYFVLRYRIKIVHARGYVPSVLALMLKRLLGRRFIFDMRGFWPDERIDGGIWKQGSFLYKLAKWFERLFLTHADVIISLTSAGVAALREFPCLKHTTPWFEVIPTCTDLDRFHPSPDASGRLPSSSKHYVIGMVGNVATWYLFDNMLRCFELIREFRSDTRLLILNRSDHEYIRQRLKANRIPESIVEVKSVPTVEVANEVRKMDAGVFFIKPGFSKLGSMPTKLGEFLGCGVPCLSNAGVGDLEMVLEVERVGVVVRDFSHAEMEDAVQRFLALLEDPEIKQRCVDLAHRYFSLSRGVESYSRIYSTLTNNQHH